MIYYLLLTSILNFLIDLKILEVYHKLHLILNHYVSKVKYIKNKYFFNIKLIHKKETCFYHVDIYTYSSCLRTVNSFGNLDNLLWERLL